MTSKLFCPNCGAPVAEGDRYCQSCGAKLEIDFVPAPKAQEAVYTPSPPRYQPPPGAPVQPPPPQQVSGPAQPGYYVPPAQPGVAQPSYRTISGVALIQYKADLLKRIAAFIIDFIIFGIIGAFCGIILFFKDVIPEQGKSFGKGMFGIKVVDFDTGRPITAGQACMRQMGYIISCGIDMFVPFFTTDGRRLGDYMANSIVIEDI